MFGAGRPTQDGERHPMRHTALVIALLLAIGALPASAATDGGLPTPAEVCRDALPTDPQVRAGLEVTRWYLHRDAPLGNVDGFNNGNGPNTRLRMDRTRPSMTQPARYLSFSDIEEPGAGTPHWTGTIPAGRTVVCARAVVHADDPTYTSGVDLRALLLSGQAPPYVLEATAHPQGDGGIIFTSATTRIVTADFPALDIPSGELTLLMRTPTRVGSILYDALFQDSHLLIVTANA